MDSGYFSPKNSGMTTISAQSLLSKIPAIGEGIGGDTFIVSYLAQKCTDF